MSAVEASAENLGQHVTGLPDVAHIVLNGVDVLSYVLCNPMNALS